MIKQIDPNAEYYIYTLLTTGGNTCSERYIKVDKNDYLDIKNDFESLFGIKLKFQFIPNPHGVFGECTIRTSCNKFVNFSFH